MFLKCLPMVLHVYQWLSIICFGQIHRVMSCTWTALNSSYIALCHSRLPLSVNPIPLIFSFPSISDKIELMQGSRRTSSLFHTRYCCCHCCHFCCCCFLMGSSVSVHLWERDFFFFLKKTIGLLKTGDDLMGGKKQAWQSLSSVVVYDSSSTCRTFLACLWFNCCLTDITIIC